MVEFFQGIYEVFEANSQNFIDAGLQPVRTIDRFRGQTTEPEKFEYFPTPAIFIGLKINWQRQGGKYVGIASIDFHIQTDGQTETGNYFTGHEQALQQTFFYKSVQKLLDEFETEYTSKLIRSDETDIDTGVVQYNILSYTCEVYEAVGSTGQTLNMAGLSIVLNKKGIQKGI